MIMIEPDNIPNANQIQRHTLELPPLTAKPKKPAAKPQRRLKKSVRNALDLAYTVSVTVIAFVAFLGIRRPNGEKAATK